MGCGASLVGDSEISGREVHRTWQTFVPTAIKKATLGSKILGLQEILGRGGRTLRKDVLLPSKHLLSAFYDNTPF